MHHISLYELYRLQSVILVLSVVRPTASVGADHVGSVSDGAEGEGIGFVDDGF